MEKNTILAIVLSVLLLLGFSLTQRFFFPPKPSVPSTTQELPAPIPADSRAAEVLPVTGSPTELSPSQAGAVQGSSQISLADTAVDSGPQTEQRVTIDTELLQVVLSNSGGDVVSWKLKQHKDKDDYVEMVLSGQNEAHAFALAFGGINAQPLTSYFNVRRNSDYSVEFYRDFSAPSGGVFTLSKRYDFKPKDYMFELTVKFTVSQSNSNLVSGFNFGGSAYTLTFGPQIGPRFEKLDNRYDYRQYFSYGNGKRKQEKANNSLISSPAWAAICGKYFAFIAIPSLAQYDVSFSDKAEAGLPSASRLNIIRPALNVPGVEDKYYFYLGPKTQDVLALYSNGKSEFGLIHKDRNLIEAASTRGPLGPLEKALKWLLLIFYKLVPNYGIAIILLTLLVKILFFPLTKKGSESTLRMQALAPKIKELQEKYKDNPQKLNTEMAEFYKKEGYNPLSGCLPMLLQIPIFFAMYNLFNNHFDLRGAMFIPGWIPDLSLPEAIWNFPDGFRLPLLGWTALRLLPFIYVGSQLLYGRVTQTPDQQGNSQMKMMLYVMPIVFFFILYDVPSGLLVYWIFSNVLTLVQQLAINKYLVPKRAAQTVKPEPVIAPKRGKRK